MDFAQMVQAHKGLARKGFVHIYFARKGFVHMDFARKGFARMDFVHMGWIDLEPAPQHPMSYQLNL